MIISTKAWDGSLELGMRIEPKFVGDIANSASPKQFLSLFYFISKLGWELNPYWRRDVTRRHNF
jgi:hypothetical protein